MYDITKTKIKTSGLVEMFMQLLLLLQDQTASDQQDGMFLNTFIILP